MIRNDLLIIILIIINFIYRIDSLSCGSYSTNLGANYDLTELIRTADQGAYTVIDGDIPCTKQVESNYTYYFNICGTVVGNVPIKCRPLPGISGASALQVNERGSKSEFDDYCFIAGSYVESTTTLDVIDSQDPTKGLKLTYLGDSCSNGSPRKFHIELQCADRLNPVPTHALELAPCEYTVTMPSVYGCPLECPVSNRKLCGGNGHCAYDYDSNKAKCFCNHGYEGSDCNTVTSTASPPLNYSPALLGLIITLFIIIAILVGGILFMIRQLAAYKDDITNYQALKGGDEDSSRAVV